MRLEVPSRTLQAITQTVTTFFESSITEFHPDRIRSEQVTADRSLYLAFEIPVHSFTHATGRAQTVGIPWERLATQLNEFTDGETLTLDVSIDTLSVSTGRYNYSLSLKDVDTLRRDTTVPDITHSVVASVLTDEFQNSITAVQHIDDTLTVTADPDAEQFTLAADTDAESISVTVPMNPIEATQTVQARFPVAAITQVADNLAGEKIKIELSTDTSIDITSPLPHDAGRVKYVVSPAVSRNSLIGDQRQLTQTTPPPSEPATATDTSPGNESQPRPPSLFSSEDRIDEP